MTAIKPQTDEEPVEFSSSHGERGIIAKQRGPVSVRDVIRVINVENWDTAMPVLVTTAVAPLTQQRRMMPVHRVYVFEVISDSSR
jgi:hypothetical protein